VGAAIDIAGGSAVITESTFAGNQANGGHAGAGGSGFPPGNNGTDGEGMGVAVANSGSLTLIGVTISTNTVLSGSGFGGGLATFGVGSSSLFNTLIAANTASDAPDVSGPVVSQGHNLIGDGTGGTGYDASDLVGTSDNPIDPMLGPLQDNGGPTQTMALLPGSPAIDAGDNTGAADFDQRGPGFPRIVNGTIDIGAFEYQGTAPDRSVAPKVQAGALPVHSALAPAALVADQVAGGGHFLDAASAGTAGSLPGDTWLARPHAAVRPAETIALLNAGILDVIFRDPLDQVAGSNCTPVDPSWTSA
jgi:hypothetical protein